MSNTYYTYDSDTSMLIFRNTADTGYIEYTGGKIVLPAIAVNATSIGISNECILPEDCSAMFGGFSKLIQADLSFFNFSNVKTVHSMFSNCTSLETVVFSSNCKSYYITDFSNMFYSCYKLKSIDINNLRVNRGTNFSEMFRECRAIEQLDFSAWETGAATDMSNMFNGCLNLKYINVSNFDTSNVIDMSAMFMSCSASVSSHLVDFSQWDVSKVTNMTHMFYNCNFEFIGLSNGNTESVTTMRGMFRDCGYFYNADLSIWNVSKVTDMSNMFCNCNKLSQINTSNGDVSKVLDFSSMFERCASLTTIGDIYTGTAPNKCTKMSGMFGDCSNLEGYLDLSKGELPELVNARLMFSGCKKLKIINLSNLKLDTIRSINFSDMFENCESLATIIAKDGNTYTNINGHSMFSCCFSLPNYIYQNDELDRAHDCKEAKAPYGYFNSFNKFYYNNKEITHTGYKITRFDKSIKRLIKKNIIGGSNKESYPV